MMELDANALYVLRKHTDLKAIYGEAPNAVLAARKQLEKQAQVVSKTLATRRAVHPWRVLYGRGHPSHHMPGVGYAPR